MNNPGSPRLLKGALVAYELPDVTPQVIPFQYNPHTVSRSLEPRSMGGEDGNPAEALRLAGAPIQTIKLEVELDAADALEASDRTAIESGIHPHLAALELLIHPRSQDIIERSKLLDVGTIEVTPPQGPFTLFILGPKRILPVRVTSFEVVEEAYDPSLNPLRAKVSLGLRVLSYDDLPRDHPGYHLFLAHQSAQEGMARGVRVGDLSGVVGQNREALLMFDRDSRYAEIETVHHTLPDGRRVAYKRRRFLPRRPPSPSDLIEVVRQGERIDLFANRVLGQPTAFWRLADANPLLNVEEPDQPRDAPRSIPLDPDF